MPPKILVIDDDRVLCEELTEALREEGYDVDNAVDSFTGRQFMSTNTYDACVLDYKMTGLSGIDLLKYMHGKNPGCRIIIVSGRPFIEKILQQECPHCKPSGVISKPFDIEQLLMTIRRLLSS